IKEIFIMKKIAEDLIAEMEATNILKSGTKYTISEYANELLTFQNMISKLIAGDEHRDDMRVDEAMFNLENQARQKGLRDHPAVHNAVLSMKQLSKEMAIVISGIRGEKLVSNALNYLDRPSTKVYKNVYVTDCEYESELDHVILTNSGILLLEVKRVKEDVVLTEEGRLVVGDKCFGGNSSLGEKMLLKRRLLKEAIEKAAADRGVEFPDIVVDSFIVFCAPYGEFIHVEDLYKKEKFTFHTAICKKIENYVGCAYYKPSHLNQLGEILKAMEENPKRYPADIDFDEIRMNIATALALLQDEEPEVETEASAEVESPLECEQDAHEVAAGQEDPAVVEFTPETEKAAPADDIENHPRYINRIQLDKFSKEALHLRRNRILAASMVAGVIISSAAAILARRS
ncbi:MAG: NERD domain-containing protein, partial [Eggerthellaceae bacterium]|nr:NERD domain-containing protein [Eggerthellaceae bacterium]